MVKFCPHRDFCFDAGHLFLLVVSLVVVYVLYQFSKSNSEQMRILKTFVQNQDDVLVHDEVVSVHKDYSQRVRDIDYQRVVNPLMPPERSNHTMAGVAINIPSRGEVGNYQQVGALVNNKEGDSKILPLFGKQTYPGSNKWLYYTSSDQYQSVKLPVVNNNKDCTDEYGCSEITNDDEVKVPAYDKEFKANIYKFDKPRYIPYLI